MNINPETDLDLEKLFLPAWAQESPSVNRYAKFTGDEERPTRRDTQRGRRPRPPRREGGGPELARARREYRPRGPRREGGAGRPPHEDRGGARPEGRREKRAPEPLPEITATIVPDEQGVESLARQIKMTGRAYPLFEIAKIILQKPERYSIRFEVKKSAEGQVAQPLFVCALDDTLWLSEDEAIDYILRKHFGTFYQTERTPTEPPKGTYTFVAQCGLSGVVLGPPNHHDYQNQLRKLHATRFGRMPFDVFKSRVKIVRDEAVVKQWIEEQSWKMEYICLNVPEPVRLANRAEVEQHFRASYKESIVKPVETHTLSGLACRTLRGGLARLVQNLLADQRRFPMHVATGLSQQFAQRGLQFFKVNKTVTHVSVARPHFLDLETTPVSEGVRRIVEFISAHPKCSRRELIEALAPSPPAEPIPVTPAEGEVAPSAAPAPEPTPEQTAVIADLHWLVHQGHVLEFANGMMDTAKKPLPRPPKPPAQPAEKPADSDADALNAAAVEAAVAVPVEAVADAPPVNPVGESVVVETSIEAGRNTTATEPTAEAAATEVPLETVATEPAAEVAAEPAPEDSKS